MPAGTIMIGFYKGVTKRDMENKRLQHTLALRLRPFAGSSSFFLCFFCNQHMNGQSTRLLTKREREKEKLVESLFVPLLTSLGELFQACMSLVC